MEEITTVSSFNEIPVIDISSLVDIHDKPQSVQKKVREIGNACKSVGFFYVKAHQIPQDLSLLHI